MKNWSIEKLIAKSQNTEKLDDAEYYLEQLAELMVFPRAESSGQFTGGYSSTIYVYGGMVYEFGYYENKVVSGVMYSDQYL